MKAVIPRGEHNLSLAAVRSLGKKNINTTVVSQYKNTLSFQSKYCHNKIVADKYPDFFQTLSEDNLILPTDEYIMIELAKNQSHYKCSLAFPEYSILEFALNKKMLLDRAKELNIPCPKTIFVQDICVCRDLLDQITFPAVIKPVRGAGGDGISFIDSGTQLEEIVEKSIQQFGPLLIQEKIPYRERYSVAILMNKDHDMRSCCVLKALRTYPVNTGPATFVESVNRPDLVNLGNALLQSINFYGVAEIEFVIDQRDNTPKLMEINPRLWGSLQGAINAGVDFPFLLYTLFRDGDIDQNLNYRKGVRTRNAIGNDHRRLGKIIGGNNPISIKITSVIEFLQFYKDDGYYIFDLEDMQPFTCYFIHTIRRTLESIFSH
jgi:predicted ATP-grasp superfamily ATP-dependent carboligase